MHFPQEIAVLAGLPSLAPLAPMLTIATISSIALLISQPVQSSQVISSLEPPVLLNKQMEISGRRSETVTGVNLSLEPPIPGMPGGGR